MARKKAASPTWRTKDGREIVLSAMTDSHLANAIKMVARNCHNAKYNGKMETDSTYKKLAAEAKKRNMRITILNPPVEQHGRMEYVDVFIPTPRTKLSPILIPSDWDSRLEE